MQLHSNMRLLVPVGEPVGLHLEVCSYRRNILLLTRRNMHGRFKLLWKTNGVLILNLIFKEKHQLIFLVIDIELCCEAGVIVFSVRIMQQITQKRQ